MTVPPFMETKFGFNWGGAIVERTADEPGGAVIITIRSKYGRIEVRVTKTGHISDKKFWATTEEAK